LNTFSIDAANIEKRRINKYLRKVIVNSLTPVIFAKIKTAVVIAVVYAAV
jgi:hypothetical protein